MRIPISPAAPRVTSVTDRAHAEALVAESGVTFLPDVAVTLLLNESAINGWDDVERRWRDQMGLPTDAA